MIVVERLGRLGGHVQDLTPPRAMTVTTIGQGFLARYREFPWSYGP